MLLSRIASRHSSPSVRPILLFRSKSSRTSVQCFHTLRRSSTSTSKVAQQQTSKRPIYPERLIVFHAGTGRSVFLGCLKVTTIFIFSFFCLVVAPTHFYSEDQPKWVAAAVLLSGTVPMVFVSYISSPFVAHIRLRVPHFARLSREMLMRYSHNLPRDAKLEITTISIIGKPRVTLVRVDELRPAKERFGMANYVRDTKKINSKRPWWMGSAVRQFAVHGGVRIPQGQEIWQSIANGIVKRSV